MTDKDLLSRLVIAFDRRQRLRMNIWEFSQDPDCILRLGTGSASMAAELSDGTVIRPGDTVGIIHLWNERIPKMPVTGPDLAWARKFIHSLSHSFRLLARYLVEEQALTEVAAFGGDLPFVFTPGALNALRRLGLEVFDPLPPRTLKEKGIDLGARVWTWLLRRAFNPGSIRGQRLSDIRRRPTWISRQALIALYGPASSPTFPRERPAVGSAELEGR